MSLDPLHLEDFDPDYQRKFSRQRIKDAWNHSCAYCGRFADTLDHVIPKSKGGATAEWNLIAACRECNQSKGSNPVNTWYPTQPFYCPERMARIVEATQMQRARDALMESQQYQQAWKAFGVNRVHHYFEDVEGDWLETW